MFGPRFQIMRLAGFNVYVDLSWFVIAVLITMSLAQGLFAQPDLYQMFGEGEELHQRMLSQPGLRWLMGAAGAIGLFVSIVLHEMGHAIVARWFGIEIRGITLFIFGGVAEMASEPPSAKSEFWVAIAGPIMSVLIGGMCFALLATPVPMTAAIVLGYLGAINFVLVAFNMIPAFPLDGGRVLRSILWAAKGSLRWATKVTSRIGSAFGIILIGLGLLFAINGNLFGGLWWVLIGLFLRQAASMSYQQLLLRRALEGEKVYRFMRSEPVTVPPQVSVEDLVNNYVYRYHHKLFPVTDNGHLLGCVSTSNIKDLPQEEWPRHTVGEIAGRCTAENTVSPNTDAMEALAKMNRTGASRLLVVDNGNLVGILTLKDLMKFMSLKVELEEVA